MNAFTDLQELVASAGDLLSAASTWRQLAMVTAGFLAALLAGHFLQVSEGVHVECEDKRS